MGNRVAELMAGPFGDRDSIGWAVYQSTSMAMFTPIFRNELEAELFAATLQDIFPNWDDNSLERLANDVNTFITKEVGEDPEALENYEELLSLLFDEVVAKFRQYRRIRQAVQS